MKNAFLVIPVLFAAAQLQAKSITFSFEAKVEYVIDETGALHGRLQTGSVVTGKYTFDPDAKPSINTDFTLYEFPSAKYGMTWNLANVSLQTGVGGNFSIEVMNDCRFVSPFEFYDQYWATSDCTDSSEEKLIGTNMEISGWDGNGEMLSSSALPSKFPDLARYPFKVWLTGDSIQLVADITKVTADDSLFVPFIRILPASGDFLQTQTIDPVIRIDGVKPEDVKIEKILLDEVDVTARSLEGALSGHLEGDDPVAIWQLTRPTPPPGVHEFKVKVSFPGGRTSWSQVKWNVLQAKLDKGNTRIEEKRRRPTRNLPVVR